MLSFQFVQIQHFRFVLFLHVVWNILKTSFKMTPLLRSAYLPDIESFSKIDQIMRNYYILTKKPWMAALQLAENYCFRKKDGEEQKIPQSWVLQFAILLLLRLLRFCLTWSNPSLSWNFILSKDFNKEAPCFDQKFFDIVDCEGTRQIIQHYKSDIV